MNESQFPQPANHDAAIDRLAAGELDDGARRGLFDWLDRDPRRWRRCALSLLEARELEQALAEWNAEAPRPASPVRTAPPKQPRRWDSALALAASLLVAFGLGIGARSFWAEQAPLVAQNPQDAAAGEPHSLSDTAKVAATHEPPTASQPVPEPVRAPAPRQREANDLVSPYVRSQLERRGYEIESRHAVLPAVLPDGRRVMLPVDQFQLRYVGHRTS